MNLSSSLLNVFTDGGKINKRHKSFHHIRIPWNSPQDHDSDSDRDSSSGWQSSLEVDT